MAMITDNDLKMFQERARTEFALRCDTGGIAWDSVIWDLCNEVRRLRSASKERGDCAMLRKVLRAILEEANTQYRNDNGIDLEWLIAEAHLALSAPPRNCDRYSHDEALQVWAAENENERNGCFDEWLYHEATEKEGGDNGNE